jgi:hypothetical protein
MYAAEKSGLLANRSTPYCGDKVQQIQMGLTWGAKVSQIPSHL